MNASSIVLAAADWQDYQLLDSGHGRKLERFGPVLLDRPEAQASWRPALTPAAWTAAHAVFRPSPQGRAGSWEMRQPVEPRWPMAYRDLRFWVEVGQSRQVGLFPENAPHWDWIDERVRRASRPTHVLNLFGYTGLATLAAARAGAHVTHVDASRRAVTWARENQALSGLTECPVRWIVEDALKYVGREARRGVRYDGIVMDPPAFGRGPRGELWTFSDLFPLLCQACRSVLSARPEWVVVTAYTKGTAQSWLLEQVEEMMAGFGGSLAGGELVTLEASAGRTLANALFVRWSA